MATQRILDFSIDTSFRADVDIGAVAQESVDGLVHAPIPELLDDVVKDGLGIFPRKRAMVENAVFSWNKCLSCLHPTKLFASH